MKLHRTLVRPVVTYRGETRILNSADENSPHFGKENPTRKYGLVCEDGEWRIRSNQDIDYICKSEDIVIFV
jgi:hypothetical protein